MIEALLRDLRQPEYIHVLLNPVPVYGLAAGLIGLLVAICQRSREGMDRWRLVVAGDDNALALVRLQVCDQRGNPRLRSNWHNVAGVHT